MISFNSIVFADVRYIKTVPAVKRGEWFELYENGELYLRKGNELEKLSIPNAEERKGIVDVLKSSFHVLVGGSERKGVCEFRIFRTANWSLNGITVPSDFCRKRRYSIDDLYKKYVISTPTSKFLVCVHRKKDDGDKEDNFILLGVSDKIYRLNCTYVKNDEDDDSIEIVNETPFKTLADSINEYTIEIVEAHKFRFILENEARISVVKEKIEGKRSYFLDVWNKYSDSQLSELIKSVAECGVLAIEKIEKSDRISITAKGGAGFSGIAKKKNINDCYLLSRSDADTTGEKFHSALAQLRDKLNEYKSNRDKTLIPEIVDLLFENKIEMRFKSVELDIDQSVSLGKLVLKRDENIDGTVNPEFICLSGYKIYHQIENQKENFLDIIGLNNPMPELADILLATDERNEPDRKYRPEARCFIDDSKAIEYFNAGTDRGGEYLPTKSQIDALKVALQTPDIAIIWGPPGTGKTTLITAILHAIENIDKPKYGTLLTTFQHVALDNLMEKTEVNGLPCLRYGGKDVGQSTLFGDPLLDKLRQKGDALAQKYPGYKRAEICAKLDTRIIQMAMMQLTHNNVLNFLQGVLDDCAGSVSPPELKELIKFRNKIKQKIEVRTNRVLIGAINNLRHSQIAYFDDGELMLNYLESLADNLNLDILTPMLSEYKIAVSKSDFARAEEIKRSMLVDLCGKKRCYLENGEKEALVKLLSDLKYSVKQDLARRAELEETVLAEYVSIFRNNFAEVVSVIKKYNKYSGVTHNQLDNKKVQQSLKNKEQFENVIIDEAARSSPMDLYVVMSRASDRIILVGDHCQLPQYTDRNLFRKAQNLVEEERRAEQDGENYSSDEDDTVDISLFEKLINVGNKLAKNDGIQRVAMLEEQFRMPYELGDYVSKQFYFEKLKSDKNSEYKHLHNLQKYREKCMVFKNIPSLKKDDFEQLDSTRSRFRKNEADWIVENLKEILEDENSSGLSIGIMSFYNAQCEKIKKGLVSLKIFRYADENAKECVVVDKYRERGNTVYVGTVDSFQGRQFDIVYLSMTVSNGKKDIGHLRSTNRLCVSMSRAKKLMIVAGDEKMLTEIQALEYYRQCCKNSAKGIVL